MSSPSILERYPDIRLGFTTANFAKVLPATPINTRKLIDFASANNFAFVELRDIHAKLTLEDCQGLSAYAAQQGIEIVYAMGCGLLDPNFWDIFSRGIANAGALGGLKIVRTLTTGMEMQNDPQKKYWDEAEFSKIVQIANQAANTAKMFGLQFVVENAREGLQGDGIDTFGTADFFGGSGVNENVGWQMDVGNFFCASRVPAAPDDVERFVAANASKIAYTHIKSSLDHKSKAVLDGNELPFEIFLDLLSQHGKNHVAIEFLQIADLSQIQANHLTSVDYLQREFSRRASARDDGV